MLTLTLQVGAVVFAFVSAGLWFWSAQVLLPPFTLQRSSSGTDDHLAPTPRDRALKKQLRFNGQAAAAGGVSVVLQGALMLLPLAEFAN